MKPRQLFDSIETHRSGDLHIKAVTPEQLAFITSDTVMKSEGRSTFNAFMAEFTEEFTGEKWITPHLRINGIWVVTINTGELAEPDEPQVVESDRRTTVILALIGAFIGSLALLALWGAL